MTDRLAVGARVRVTWGRRKGYHGTVEALEQRLAALTREMACLNQRVDRLEKRSGTHARANRPGGRPTPPGPRLSPKVAQRVWRARNRPIACAKSRSWSVSPAIQARAALARSYPAGPR